MISSRFVDAPEPNVAQGHPADSIKALLDAAETAILAKGIDKVTIDDFAHVAGVSRATIYRRVGGREDTITAILRRHAAPFVKETEAAIAGEFCFQARIKAGMIHAIEALPRYPLLVLMFSNGLSPYNLRIVRPVYRELVDASFLELFKQAQAEGAISAELEMAELSEWQLRNFLHLAADGPHQRPDLERYIDLFILPVLRPNGIEQI